jgi:GDP-4-dehydro-6-deoxy-D-mannose reductase
MRVVITGADGFVGPHLARSLSQAGHQVTPCGGPRAAERALDVLDPVAVSELLAAVRPDAVVHLAGWSSVGSSFQEPLACFTVNALGAAHLFEAVRTQSPSSRVLLISSGEVYGPAHDEHLRTEREALAPASPYAMSKQAAELVARQYQSVFGIHTVIARAFNHVGSGQDQKFVVPSLLRQVMEVKSGRRPALIRVGNLDPVRDFSHVLDVVEAYGLLLESGVSGQAYNVCSGRGRAIREVLFELMRRAGVEAEVQIDAALARPVDIPHLVGDPAELTALGWRPHREPFAALFSQPGAAS